MNARFASAVGAVVLLSLGLPAGAANTAIDMRKDVGPYFSRAYVRILVGDTVTWRNTSEEPHTVASYPDAPVGFRSHPDFDSARGCDDQNLLTEEDCMDPGEAFEVTFDQPGSYKFYCQLHADPGVEPDASVSASEQPCGMCGVVSVVLKEAKPRPRTVQSGSGPRATATRRVAPPKRKATATPSPSPSDSRAALAATRTSGKGGGGGKLTLALLSIVALGGAGYLTWRRFLGSPSAV